VSAAIFGPEILILLVFVVPVLGIWVAIDAGSKPPWAFDRIGQNKTLWVVLPLVGIFFCGIVTIVAAVMWFASIRARVISATSAAPGGALATPRWNAGPSPQPAFAPPGVATPPLQIPAQWSADPIGRHELRYWNGTTWTEHVSDAGVSSTDPLEPPA
jgi:uncharacterized protein DUF2510